nr:hypothetical protein [Anaerolineae bacterium]
SGLRWLVLEFADCDTTRFPDPKPSECGNPFFPQNTGKAEAEFQVLVLDDTGNRFEGHLLAMPLNDPMRAAVEVNLFLDELWSVWFDVISSRERCGEGNSDSATIVRTDPDRWEIQATSEQIACLTHNTKLDGRKPAIVVEGYYPLPFNVVVACNNAQQCEDLTPAAN